MSHLDKELISSKCIVQFTLPRLHKGKQCYVDFFAYDPARVWLFQLLHGRLHLSYTGRAHVGERVDGLGDFGLIRLDSSCSLFVFLASCFDQLPLFFQGIALFFLRSSTCFFNFWSSSTASFELRETMVFCVLLVAIAMSRMNLYGIENWFLASYRRFSMLANHRLKSSCAMVSGRIPDTRLRTAGSPQTWKLRARSLCSLYLDRDHPLGPSIVPGFHYIWVL